MIYIGYGDIDELANMGNYRLFWKVHAPLITS